LGEFDGATPIADVLAYVDQLRAMPGSVDDLVNLLPEQSPIYAGRPTGDAELLRGYVLASFERTGLPQSVMAYVVEELQSGHNPYVVAAAARAARGAETMPEHIAPLLLDAIERIRQSDDVVRFDRAATPEDGTKPTTALMELFRTLARLGPQARIALPVLEAMLARYPPVFADDVRADAEIAVTAISRPHQTIARSCCAGEPMPVPLLPSNHAEIEHVELQDQDGRVFRFRDFFAGRPSILTFFYTRCMNPNKCSLTVTKLARVQQRIRAAGLYGRINVAGVSYDPAFDLPPRLRAYGTNRGMSFDDRTRLMRTTGPFDPFQQRFNLGVGYGTTTVNQHRLDTLLLDDQGYSIASFARVQWHEEDMLGALKSALTPAITRAAGNDGTS
jgi:cytochrome oxidase Cu insertion factor (SCO1/SenC/PrrC family)